MRSIIYVFIFFCGAYYLMGLPATSTKETTTNEKRTLKEDSKAYIFPVKGKQKKDIISFYGDKRAGGKRKHEGVDIPADRGTPVLAITDGEIVKVANKGNGGKQVWLKAKYGHRKFFYAHLDEQLVEEGQHVKKGDVIATVGNTGNARHTLPHLHFGIYEGRRKTVDPMPFIP